MKKQRNCFHSLSIIMRLRIEINDKNNNHFNHFYICISYFSFFSLYFNSFYVISFLLMSSNSRFLYCLSLASSSFTFYLFILPSFSSFLPISVSGFGNSIFTDSQRLSNTVVATLMIKTYTQWIILVLYLSYFLSFVCSV